MRGILIGILVVVMLSGCSVAQRQGNMQDGSIADAQSRAQVACYQAQAAGKPDMSGWSADKITAYQAMEKLSQANLIIAGKSVDPCAGAGGTNIYDAEIGIAKADADVKKATFSFAENALTKSLYALVAYKAFDALEEVTGGARVDNNGDGDINVSVTKSTNEEWAGGGVGEGAQGGATGGGGSYADLPVEATDTGLTTEGVTLADE